MSEAHGLPDSVGAEGEQQQDAEAEPHDDETYEEDDDEEVYDGEGEDEIYVTPATLSRTTKESWRREAPTARLWLVRGTVLGLLGLIFGPMILIGMGRITAAEARDLISQLMPATTAVVSAIILVYFVDPRNRRKKK